MHHGRQVTFVTVHKFFEIQNLCCIWISPIFLNLLNRIVYRVHPLHGQPKLQTFLEATTLLTVLVCLSEALLVCVVSSGLAWTLEGWVGVGFHCSCSYVTSGLLAAVGLFLSLFGKMKELTLSTIHSSHWGLDFELVGGWGISQRSCWSYVTPFWSPTATHAADSKLQNSSPSTCCQNVLPITAVSIQKQISHQSKFRIHSIAWPNQNLCSYHSSFVLKMW